MADELKVGDVVQLKSGSPQMTIDGIDDYGNSGTKQARCVWFDGPKKLYDVFGLATLVKVD